MDLSKKKVLKSFKVSKLTLSCCAEIVPKEIYAVIYKILIKLIAWGLG